MHERTGQIKTPYAGNRVLGKFRRGPATEKLIQISTNATDAPVLKAQRRSLEISRAVDVAGNDLLLAHILGVLPKSLEHPIGNLLLDSVPPRRAPFGQVVRHKVVHVESGLAGRC